MTGVFLEGEISERSQAIFERFFECLPDAILVTGSDGCIQAANPRAEELFGYSRQELIGSPVEMLLPEHLREKHIRQRGEYQVAPRMRPMDNTWCSLWCGTSLSAKRWRRPRPSLRGCLNLRQTALW